MGTYLALDFGASSGRAILGHIQDGKLNIEEVHRFENETIQIGKNLYWDTFRLLHEIKQSILKCHHFGANIKSMGIDTWGVDFGLLDREGRLLGVPYTYRDPRTDGMQEIVDDIIGSERLYEITGIQSMFFNTILQLSSMRQNGDAILDLAEDLLFTPDLLAYFLTGKKITEYSIASTSQLLDAKTGSWSNEIIDKLNLPRKIFGKVSPSGSDIGMLRSEVCQELGVQAFNVVATAGHDTQSAVAAVPSDKDDFIFISCGTWSLLGVELDNALTSSEACAQQFTNEGGVGGKINFMKNIMGLWLVQECRRRWVKQGATDDFGELSLLAKQAPAFGVLLNPDDDSFIAPADMPVTIKTFWKDTNQDVSDDKGVMLRCIAESLALKYRATIEDLEDLHNKKYDTIYMVGGGIQDSLLCQLTADATGRQVVAGPIEATAAGNIITQAIASGEVADLTAGRKLIADSFDNKIYIPKQDCRWETHYKKFKSLLK